MNHTWLVDKNKVDENYIGTTYINVYVCNSYATRINRLIIPLEKFKGGGGDKNFRTSPEGMAGRRLKSPM